MRRKMLLVGAVVVTVVLVSAAWARPSIATAPSLVSVDGKVLELKADGRHVAMLVARLVGEGSAECSRDVLVWDRARGAFAYRLIRPEGYGCQTFGSDYGLAVAGDRLAWVEESVGNYAETQVYLASVASGRTGPVELARALGGVEGDVVGNPHGHGSLLVYNRYRICRQSRDPDYPADVPCPPGYRSGAIVKDAIVMIGKTGRREIATSDHALAVLAVGGGRVVALREGGGLIVLAPKDVRERLVSHGDYAAERLIATYAYKPGEVRAAATDGHTLAVLRAGFLDLIPLPGGHGSRTTRKLPHAASYGPESPGVYAARAHDAQLRLNDLDGNVAVYTRGNAVYLLDLTTGRSVIVARPTAAPVSAQLEPDGLYIAAGRTLTFTPRSQVEQRLHR